MTTWHTHSIPVMGTTLTLLGGAERLGRGQVRARLHAAARDVAVLAGLWTRFSVDSALELLNAAATPTVRVDPRLGTAVAAALDARRRSGGLVDPVLRDAIAEAGYDATITRLPRIDPAVVAAYARTALPTPARAHPRPARLTVSPDRRWIRRAPGVRLDLGGTAKGLAADLAATRLRDLDRWVVDVGGDLRAGGTRRDVPQRVDVAGPVDGATVATLVVDRGAVATSTVTRRAWRDGVGAPAHHLLDPSTGRPAWTGVLQATARARTALAAERIAKTALLSGARTGAAVLRAHEGGVLVLADGTVVEVCP